VTTTEQPNVQVGIQGEKDFDQERARKNRQRILTFKAGGESFHVKANVRPEDIYPQATEAEIADKKMIWDVYDRYIRSMVLDEEAETWDKVRRSADPALNLQDLEDIVSWLIEAASGRPTEKLSSSGRGPGQSGATSRDHSALRTT